MRHALFLCLSPAALRQSAALGASSLKRPWREVPGRKRFKCREFPLLRHELRAVTHIEQALCPAENAWI